MKQIALIVAVGIMLSACGNTSVDNEMVGQAKKLQNVTPIVCMDYKAFDVSLGVMRGGTGSMSSQDLWFTVTNEQDLATMKKAVETGALVKVHYRVRRWAPCSHENWMTSVEIIN